MLARAENMHDGDEIPLDVEYDINTILRLNCRFDAEELLIFCGTDTDVLQMEMHDRR